MFGVLQDTIVDSIKLIPFLFITYLIMELIEHSAGEKTEKLIKKSGKFGPLLGALLGVVPQCGFSAVAANFYAAKIITRGTLIAIFLSTSDEMLPILISEGADVFLKIKDKTKIAYDLNKIENIKIAIGIGIGITIDLLSKNHKENKNSIHSICENENCNCDEEGVIKSSINHTLQIFAYIFIISLVINSIIFAIGEEKIASLAVNVPVVGTLLAALVGVIPNCASSIILTELYLEKIITLGPMIAGLLVNSGIGVLILFKVNKDKKDNFKILGILYLVGVTAGIIIDLLI